MAAIGELPTRCFEECLDFLVPTHSQSEYIQMCVFRQNACLALLRALTDRPGSRLGRQLKGVLPSLSRSKNGAGSACRARSSQPD